MLTDNNYRAHLKDLAFALVVTIVVGIVGDYFYAQRLTPLEASCFIRRPYAMQVLVVSEKTGESVAGSVCRVEADAQWRGKRKWLYFDYREPR